MQSVNFTENNSTCDSIDNNSVASKVQSISTPSVTTSSHSSLDSKNRVGRISEGNRRVVLDDSQGFPESAGRSKPENFRRDTVSYENMSEINMNESQLKPIIIWNLSEEPTTNSRDNEISGAIDVQCVATSQFEDDNKNKPDLVAANDSRSNVNTDIPDQETDTNVQLLNGDNQVDVEIEPDVKDNNTYVQLCSCTFVMNCFTRNSVAKN